jgi:hypothetical protein
MAPVLCQGWVPYAPLIHLSFFESTLLTPPSLHKLADLIFIKVMVTFVVSNPITRLTASAV